MRKRSFVLAGVIFLCIMGCVVRTEHTINAHITLDIRHIKEQASDVLDFIEGTRDELPAAETAETEQSFLQRAWEMLDPMPTAYAQEDLNRVSPRVKQIASKMRERYGKVEAFKKQGCFGENNRGYVELRECDDLTDADARNAAQQLMAEENKDRKALYNEVARLNEDEGVAVSTVEKVYASERLTRAGTGEVVQLPVAGDAFDAFKQSAKGQALGSQCQPGAWVTLP